MAAVKRCSVGGRRAFAASDTRRYGLGQGTEQGIDRGTVKRSVVRAFSGESLPRTRCGWIPVRVKKTRQNIEIEPSFRFYRNGKGSSLTVRWNWPGQYRMRRRSDDRFAKRRRSGVGCAHRRFQGRMKTEARRRSPAPAQRRRLKYSTRNSRCACREKRSFRFSGRSFAGCRICGSLERYACPIPR
jgi:hypothetical protein